MNPEDFLETAALLLLNNRESDYRSAVSRSYYAAYHMLRLSLLQIIPLTLLQNSGIGSKYQISHDKLPVALKNLSDPAIAKMGEHLLRLKLERTRADYRLESPISKACAVAEYSVALNLRDELKAFGVKNLALILKNELEKTYGAT